MSIARVATVLAVLLLLAAPYHSAAGELSSEEQKWVRDCLKRLGANSPRVRQSAESALAGLFNPAGDEADRKSYESTTRDWVLGFQ